MSVSMSSDEYEELYLASVRVPLVLAIFLGLWGLVILVLQALQIDFSSVLRKASGRWRGGVVGGGAERRRQRPNQPVFAEYSFATHVILPTHDADKNKDIRHQDHGPVVLSERERVGCCLTA